MTTRLSQPEHMQSAIMQNVISYDVSGLKHSGRYANRTILASYGEGGIFRDVIITQFFRNTTTYLLHMRAAKQEDIIFLASSRFSLYNLPSQD